MWFVYLSSHMQASEKMGFELEIELFIMGLVTRPWPHKHSKEVTTIFKSPKLLFCVWFIKNNKHIYIYIVYVYVQYRYANADI